MLPTIIGEVESKVKKAKVHDTALIGPTEFIQDLIAQKSTLATEVAKSGCKTASEAGLAIIQTALARLVA